jgi:hypothetical protein
VSRGGRVKGKGAKSLQAVYAMNMVKLQRQEQICSGKPKENSKTDVIRM